MDLKSFDVQFRGSSNQRILDVKKSLEENKKILYIDNSDLLEENSL